MADRSQFVTMPGARVPKVPGEPQWMLSVRDFNRWRRAVNDLKNPLAGFRGAIAACFGAALSVGLTFVPWMQAYGALPPEKQNDPLFYWFGPVLVVAFFGLILLVLVFRHVDASIEANIRHDAIRLAKDMDETYEHWQMRQGGES